MLKTEFDKMKTEMKASMEVAEAEEKQNTK